MKVVKKRRRRDGSWSSLPGDVLCLIADKINSIQDYVTLCAVCRCWYIHASDFYNLRKKSNLNLPLYMFGVDPHKFFTPNPAPHLFPKNPKPTPNLTFRTFDGSERQFSIDLPEAVGRRCWGSPFGWLVTYGVVDLQFGLVNPFTRAAIPLPSITSLFPDGFLYDPPYTSMKAFLSADPENNQDCTVLLVVRPDYSNDYTLAFARPRDPVWSRFPGPGDLSDIICFKSKLYGVRTRFFPEVALVLIQIQPRPRIIKFITVSLVLEDPRMSLPGLDREIDFGRLDYFNQQFTKKHLVVLNGELCLVLRYVVSSQTVYFKIFSINLSAKEFTRVWTLGDHSLFVGNNYAFTCKAASPPPEEALEQLEHLPGNLSSNRVFYSYDDDWLYYLTFEKPLYPDVGVWDMLRFNKVYSSTDTITRYPPLWITPSISFPRLEEFGRLRGCRSIDKKRSKKKKKKMQ